MICLTCGQQQKSDINTPCVSCSEPFTTVDGIYGINNVTQMLSVVEDFRHGRCDLETLLERFDLFAEKWEGFQKRWGLDQDATPDLFELAPTSLPAYSGPLNSLEDAFVHLSDAFATLDELEGRDDKALDKVAADLRAFFQGVCSSCATIFSKLESPKGDFGSLLSALGTE